jgi:hypothetical protein
MKGLKTLVLPSDPSAHPRVVELLEVFEHISLRGFERRVAHAMDPTR